MKYYFVNFTNHPSDKWDENQKKEALKYGEIVDLPFPAVDSQRDETYICRLSEKCTEQIMELHPQAVLCQGEFNVVYQVVSRLLKQGIIVLAGCSERVVEEVDGRKIVNYKFSRFRRYENPDIACRGNGIEISHLQKG